MSAGGREREEERCDIADGRERKTCAKNAALRPTAALPGRLVPHHSPSLLSSLFSLSPTSALPLSPPPLSLSISRTLPYNGSPEPPGAGRAETRATTGWTGPERDPCSADTEAWFRRWPGLRKVRTKCPPSPPPQGPILTLPSPDLSPLFASILQTASIPTLTQPHRALACDAISTWLIRSSSSTALRDAVAAHPTAWDSLVAVIFGNFDDAQSGLSKALKDLFGNVLSTYPTVDGTRDRFMQGLADRVLDGVRSGAGRKVGYYVLEVLVRKKIVGAAWTMGRYRDLCAPCAAEDGDKLVRDMMACLKDRTLSPVIGKALVGLLSARRQEIVAAAGTQAEWMELWEAPLKSVLAVEELRGNVQIYALPGLFKISPECFGMFVEGLGLARYSDETVGDGGEDESVDDGKELMSLLCSLKVGKDLGLVGEISTCIHDILSNTPR